MCLIKSYTKIEILVEVESEISTKLDLAPREKYYKEIKNLCFERLPNQLRPKLIVEGSFIMIHIQEIDQPHVTHVFPSHQVKSLKCIE